MLYYVLGKEIEILSMRKPEGGHGSIFELTGEAVVLKEIGLNEIFYYCTNEDGRFSNKLKPGASNFDLLPPQNEEQRVLAIFLYKSIFNGELTDQYAPPHR